MKQSPIGVALIREGLIHEGQLEEAKILQQQQGGRLGEILIGMGILSEAQFQRFLAKRYKFAYANLEQLFNFPISDSLLSVFSYPSALNNLILPIQKNENGLLEVASLAPMPEELSKEILTATNSKKIHYHLATRDNLIKAIRSHYGQFLSRSLSRTKEEKNITEEILETTFPTHQNHSLLDLRREYFCLSCGYPFEPNALFCSKCGNPLEQDADPMLQQLLENKWKIVRQIGEGGMGLIYEGIHIQTKQPIAIKILRTQFKVDDLATERFYNEVQILRRLIHPNILKIHEFGYEKRTGFFLIMELLEGYNLEYYLEEYTDTADIPIKIIHNIFSKVCDGMSHAHQQNIIHRDLKPENIFLVGTSKEITQVKVLDFGIAKIQESNAKGFTQTGILLGTPRYFSPEQAMSRPLDHRSDIYSLGVILFEVLTGKALFDAESPYEYLMRHVYTQPPTLSQARPDKFYSPEFENLLRRALSKDPAQRPQTMQHFKEELFSIADITNDHYHLKQVPSRENNLSTKIPFDNQQPHQFIAQTNHDNQNIHQKDSLHSNLQGSPYSLNETEQQLEISSTYEEDDAPTFLDFCQDQEDAFTNNTQPIVNKLASLETLTTTDKLTTVSHPQTKKNLSSPSIPKILSVNTKENLSSPSIPKILSVNTKENQKNKLKRKAIPRMAILPHAIASLDDEKSHQKNAIRPIQTALLHPEEESKKKNWFKVLLTIIFILLIIGGLWQFNIFN